MLPKVLCRFDGLGVQINQMARSHRCILWAQRRVYSEGIPAVIRYATPCQADGS